MEEIRRTMGRVRKHLKEEAERKKESCQRLIREDMEGFTVVMKRKICFCHCEADRGG